MDVEIKDSAVGRLVPDHLLKFKGNSDVQCYYKELLKIDYQKGFDAYDVGQCQVCHNALTSNDCPRLKSAPFKMTLRIKRLLMKQSSGKQICKYGQHILNKYLQSKQKMVVKCSKCESPNKIDLMTKQEVILLKNQTLSNVYNSADQQEKTPKSSKKKKRKKASKKIEVFSPNSLIPMKNDDSPRPNSTPVLETPDLKRNSDSSTNKKSATLSDLVKPLKAQKQSPGSLLQRSLQTPNAKLFNKDSSSKLNKSQKKAFSSKQKQLKQYLNESVTTNEKSVSLPDFLSFL